MYFVGAYFTLGFNRITLRERFQVPVETLFEASGIDYQDLGGASVGNSSDFAYTVADWKRGLDILVWVLKDTGAPPDTTVIVEPETSGATGCEPRSYLLGDLS